MARFYSDAEKYPDVDPSVPGESLVYRQERIEKALCIVRAHVDRLEEVLLPVLADEQPMPAEDRPGMTEQRSNLARWLADTTTQLDALGNRVAGLATRVDL